MYYILQACFCVARPISQEDEVEESRVFVRSCLSTEGHFESSQSWVGTFYTKFVDQASDTDLQHHISPTGNDFSPVTYSFYSLR